MFAIDTNLLVYAHNLDSPFKEKAKSFLEKVMNDYDNYGNLKVCIPFQVIIEFINVITRENLERSLGLKEAINIVKDYLVTGIKIIDHWESQISTFIELLVKTKSRKNVFDVSLAATLKDNKITGIYTLNVSDFKTFDFLEVINPLQT